jgi:hypothetical protein
MARKRSSRRQEEHGIRDSRLFTFSTKMALSLVIAVIFLTLVQCTVKKPESPTWNTNLVVPVVNRTYPMSEIIRKIDQEGITMDQDSNVIYTLTRDIDTISLDADNLSTGDLSYSFAQQIGLMEIDPPSVPPVTVSFAQISGLATGAVPPSSFQVTNDIPTVTTFSSASLAGGNVWVEVTNNLGIDLDTVRLTLRDVGNNQTVGTQSFAAGLTDGETDSVQFDLSGSTLSNQFEVIADCHTTGGTVLSASGKELVTTVTFEDNLAVTTAIAAVKGTDLQFTDEVNLGESDLVYNAILAGGQLQLTIANNTSLDASLVITLPDLRNNNIPLTIARPVSANSNDVVQLDLSGYSLEPTDSTAPQAIAVEVDATVPGSGTTHVSVDQTDNFDVTAGLTDLSFSSVTGLFAGNDATIDPTVEEIEVPKGFDSLQLATAILTLEIENGVNMSGLIDITINGSNGKQVLLNGAVTSGGPSMPSTTLLIDSTVADFLFPIPDQITVTGTATFGDGNSVATITANDYVFARVNIIAPMEMTIGETTVETDIESEEIEQDDIDVVTDHVEELRFHYNITNHLPLGTTVNILLGPDSTTLLANPELVIGALTVNAAPTIAGIVSDTLSSGYQSIVLNNEDIQILTHDTLYIAQEIILHGTNGQVVRLTNSDYLILQGYFEVEYRFDGNF